MKVLVCAEARRGQVDPAVLELIGAARAIGGAADEIVVLAPGADSSCGEWLGAADRAITVRHPTLELATAEAYARVAHDVAEAERPDAILIGYTALGLDVAPNLAAHTGLPLVGYVSALSRDEGSVTAESQIYGGKMIARVETPLPAIFVLNPGRFAEAEASPLPAGCIAAFASDHSLDGLKVQFLREDLPSADDVDLSLAERIVCVGRGIGEESSIDLARDLAELLGAEVAGSRPVIDSGWLPKPRQVGKSGRKVKPKLYVALGVSGAPEHLEGMASSDLIVAVNTDPNAPIFDVAHYGATCDLFDLLPILSERLRASPGS